MYTISLTQYLEAKIEPRNRRSSYFDQTRAYRITVIAKLELSLWNYLITHWTFTTYHFSSIGMYVQFNITNVLMAVSLFIVVLLSYVSLQT